MNPLGRHPHKAHHSEDKGRERKRIRRTRPIATNPTLEVFDGSIGFPKLFLAVYTPARTHTHTHPHTCIHTLTHTYIHVYTHIHVGACDLRRSHIAHNVIRVGDGEIGCE